MKKIREIFIHKQIRLILRALCCAMVLSSLFSMTGFCCACRDIEDRVLRFHILANSDSEEDQSLKLKVRDEITTYTDKLFQNCHNKEDAMAAARNHITSIQEKALEVVRNEGYNYPVRASVTKANFDTRVYKDFTLPAGTYDAVRIVIGSGEGHNWWCVLYPAVCVPSAEKKIGSALTEGETEIVTDSDRYVVKFKIVEWMHSLFSYS